MHMINFSFPWGGFGTFFNSHAIRRLFRPIQCNASSPEDVVRHRKSFEMRVCERVAQNLLGEASLFRSGMSVGDLGIALAHLSSCLHGDWLVGYLVNFYFLSSKVQDPHYAGVDHARLWHTAGSSFVPGLAEEYGRKLNGRNGHCTANKNRPELCSPAKSLVCHGVNASRMAALSNATRAATPPDHPPCATSPFGAHAPPPR